MTELTENEIKVIIEALKAAKGECVSISSTMEGWCTGGTVEKIQKALYLLS